jgi:hypothetical protein
VTANNVTDIRIRTQRTLEGVFAQWAAERRAVEVRSRTVRCQTCSTPVGAPCRTRSGAATRAHSARFLDGRDGAIVTGMSLTN